MSIKTLWRLWKQFWFTPESPVPVALARIVFGLLLIQFGVLLAPELHSLLGERSVLPRMRANAWWGTPAFSVLDYLPHNDLSLDCLLAIFLVCAISLTLGIWTRISALAIWIIMSSFYARNAFAFGASDSILRTVALLLVFSHAGDALSLRRIFEVWLSGPCPSGPPPSGRPWALRLIQVHFALVWWVGLTRKMQGADWMNGNAVYYVSHSTELVRYPLPFLPDNLLTAKFLTWSTMVMEFSLAVLIWIQELRIPLIVTGALFHLAMDWALWVPQFEFVMIAGLITFLDAATLSRLMDWIRRSVRHLGLTQVTVVYDSRSDLSSRLAETVRRLDIFKLVELVEHDTQVSAGTDRSEMSQLVLVSGNTHLTGAVAARDLARRLPALALFYPLLFLPAAPAFVARVSHMLSRRYA